MTVYVCNMCPEGERFQTPADAIGQALMAEHLTDVHGVPAREVQL